MNAEKTTAERLVELRRQLGLDQEELAAQLMVSRSYLSQLENGREPSLKLLELLRRLELESEQKDVHPVNIVHEPGLRIATPSEDQASEAEIITEKIQAKICEVMTAAAGDPLRLGWVHEQVSIHLRPPTHWPKPAPRPKLPMPPLLVPKSQPHSPVRGVAHG